ncbi:MAG: hypothetical protein LBU25_03825 [Treponema sp.]|nr:hypothetical protein [Treponema sp.]
METLNQQLQKLDGITRNIKEAIKKSFSAVEVIVNPMDTVQTDADSQIRMVGVTTDSTKRIVGHIEGLDSAIQTQASNIVESSAAIDTDDSLYHQHPVHGESFRPDDGKAHGHVENRATDHPAFRGGIPADCPAMRVAEGGK